MIKRDAWEEAGQFDEKYAHYGQENALLFNMQKKGWLTIWRTDAFVYHFGRASSRKKKGWDDKAERAKANKLYKELTEREVK